MSKTDAFRWRCSGYVLGVVAIGWGLLASNLSHAQKAYDAGDLSAFAWTAFWPFIYPLFWVEAFALVLPFAALVELVLWVVRRTRE